MNTQDYVRQILQARTRQERQAQLANVPFHLRGKVQAHVEFLWSKPKTRKTRNRKTPRCDA